MANLIYRFMPATGAIKTILDKSLKVSRISRLNDPYDSVPGIIEIPEDLKDPDREGISPEEFIRNMTDKNFGIVSFTKTATDPVLWAHYADNHRGLCLAFDTSVFPNDAFVDINYSDDRPCIRFARMQDKGYLQELGRDLDKALTTKSKSWAYEKEVRLILSTIEVEEPLPEFYGIPKGFLKEVILGVDCEYSPSNIRSLLIASNFQDVKIKIAMRQGDKFKVRLMDYIRFDMDEYIDKDPELVAKLAFDQIKEYLELESPNK